MPEAVGVPLMVTTSDAQLPVTPAGRPVTVAPVAPVVAYVVAVAGVLTHKVCEPPVVNVTVLSGVTVIVPLAVTVPQPPDSVTV